MEKLKMKRMTELTSKCYQPNDDEKSHIHKKATKEYQVCIPL